MFRDLRGFIIIWGGQVFSMIGSQMTQFAMGIWAWEKTGQATPLALVGFLFFCAVNHLYAYCWRLSGSMEP